MKIAAVLASSILAFAALAAQAADPEVSTFKVHYADLNLDREAGVAALFERLRVAAKRVCSDAVSQLLSSRKAYAECIEQAIATAVVQINRPTVSKYVAQRLRKPLPEADTRVAAQ